MVEVKRVVGNNSISQMRIDVGADHLSIEQVVDSETTV